MLFSEMFLIYKYSQYFCNANIAGVTMPLYNFHKLVLNKSDETVIDFSNERSKHMLSVSAFGSSIFNSSTNTLH